jgi:hypothetical protein
MRVAPAVRTKGIALRAVALIVAVLAVPLVAAAVPAEAKKYKSTFVAAPSYPESTLAMSVRGNPRARGIATLRVTGSNASRDDGDGLAFDYTLDVYVMDRSVYRSCAPSLREANNRQANLPGKVEHIGLNMSLPASGPFTETIKYRTERFRKLVYCAYTTYVSDDAAMGQLKHDLRKRRKRG